MYIFIFNLIFLDENLCGVNHQLQNDHLKHIRDILLAAESTYIKQFNKLCDEISEHLAQAKSNIEYLQVTVPLQIYLNIYIIM